MTVFWWQPRTFLPSLCYWVLWYKTERRVIRGKMEEQDEFSQSARFSMEQLRLTPFGKPACIKMRKSTEVLDLFQGRGILFILFGLNQLRLLHYIALITVCSTSGPQETKKLWIVTNRFTIYSKKKGPKRFIAPWKWKKKKKAHSHQASSSFLNWCRCLCRCSSVSSLYMASAATKVVFNVRATRIRTSSPISDAFEILHGLKVLDFKNDLGTTFALQVYCTYSGSQMEKFR